MSTRHLLLAGTAIFCGLFAMGNSIFAQDTAFTYQGRLANAGQPANGSYDMTFALFNAVTGGSQVGNTNIVTAIGVTNGLFTVELDFGGNFPGADRWLEIGVRPSGGGAFTTLSPRQKFTATPYAITAGNLTGGLPAIQLSGIVPAAQAGSLTNHSDVVVAGLTAGQVLVYNGTVWANATAFRIRQRSHAQQQHSGDAGLFRNERAGQRVARHPFPADGHQQFSFAEPGGSKRRATDGI